MSRLFFLPLPYIHSATCSICSLASDLCPLGNSFSPSLEPEIKWLDILSLSLFSLSLFFCLEFAILAFPRLDSPVWVHSHRLLLLSRFLLQHHTLPLFSTPSPTDNLWMWHTHLLSECCFLGIPTSPLNDLCLLIWKFPMSSQCTFVLPTWSSKISAL